MIFQHQSLNVDVRYLQSKAFCFLAYSLSQTINMLTIRGKCLNRALFDAQLWQHKPHDVSRLKKQSSNRSNQSCHRNGNVLITSKMQLSATVSAKGQQVPDSAAPLKQKAATLSEHFWLNWLNLINSVCH